MIERYTHPAMRTLWSDDSIFKAWLEVELMAAEAWSALGVIPKDDVVTLRARARFNVDRIREIEAETRHDVVAFTRAVSESLGEEKKWIHYGLTSTDVVDTAYGLLYKKANALILAALDDLLTCLKNQAVRYKNVPTIGRTHGVHAEITSFGLKLLRWYDELSRDRDRFLAAAKDVACGKLSGAVGTFANTPPFVQDYVCQRLGLESAAISTQVLPRDRHAAYFATLALMGATLEQLCTEIRHLQRTEVREVEERFQAGQKGSSAMPHKRNPIGSENICGCARLLRSYMVAAYEDVSLWHERDISHSSVERVIGPDATSLIHHMLTRTHTIVDTLVVFPERMAANIALTHGVIHSQTVMLSLVDAGLSREAAYDLVQPLAMKAWHEGLSFRTLIEREPTIRATLSDDTLTRCFDPAYHLKTVDTLYDRVLKGTRSVTPSP